MQLYGLIYHVESTTEEALVPLQNVAVEANIVDMISEVTISQTYKNLEEHIIDASYRFPIYEGAAICGFEAEIDGKRVIKGVVKESKEAAKEYKEAVSQGFGAYLLEEQFADVFVCSIGNVSPGQTVIIRITYVSELKHDAETEKIRFVLPTVSENFSKFESTQWNIAAWMAYLQIVMSEFTQEWELCYEKAERALKILISKDASRDSENQNSQLEEILVSARGWVSKWFETD
ncbi:hypothetical protein G9A89_007150 [Geosiphon pyriformis]|nr:hypothetical protein G9A89_007150 [Geosiphon pyriformis]